MLCSLYKVLYKKRSHVDRVTAILLALALKLKLKLKLTLKLKLKLKLKLMLSWSLRYLSTLKTQHSLPHPHGLCWKPVPIIACKGTLTVYTFLSSEGLCFLRQGEVFYAEERGTEHEELCCKNQYRAIDNSLWRYCHSHCSEDDCCREWCYRHILFHRRSFF